ncbi:Membrane-associated phospholipid phosphatase (PgpB) (PDB:1D2T) [Commensalibacter communis]|nr:Membrane-associated phospholipid phosphatase (PgpB) (PDB:1D2T) [Commensalibacter communis]CAI3958264.1 Membrane-associated phospholipid phosphatase (PgpB) (PDB:1D2T) [Commensalibacter communis]
MEYDKRHYLTFIFYWGKRLSFHYKFLFLNGIILFGIAIIIALLTSLDTSLNNIFILSPTNPFVALVRVISKLGSFVIITSMTLLLGIWLWLKKRIYEAIWVVATMGSCRIVFTMLKILVGRERPVFDEPLTHALSYSFPSGHSVNSLMFLLVCYSIFSYRKSFLWIAIIGTLLIGWSRLALGAHWFSDVLAGWGCGFMWISIAYQVKISIPLQNYVNKYFPN